MAPQPALRRRALSWGSSYQPLIIRRGSGGKAPMLKNIHPLPFPKNLSNCLLLFFLFQELSSYLISGLRHSGNSLAVQWLRLHISTSEDWGLIPGWGTKILQAAWNSQREKKRPSENKEKFFSFIPITLDTHNFQLFLEKLHRMSNLKFYLYHEVFWALTLKISLSSQFPSHPQFLLFIMSLLNTREKKGQKKKKMPC